MEKQGLNLEIFKKPRKLQSFPFMPTTTFTQNNNPILLKSQLIKSQKGDVLCLQLLSKSKKKKQDYFGKR